MAREYNPALSPAEVRRSMTTLEARLKDDVKAAMKSGGKDRLDVLRMLLSDAKNTAIAEGLDRSGIPDEVMLRVLKKAVKTRTESAQIYEQNGRADLAERENAQIMVIKDYLPTEMSEAEVEVVVDTVIVELGARDKSAMGGVIKAVLERVAGAADGGTVSRIVKARLA
jgi:hypothetical protein